MNNVLCNIGLSCTFHCQCNGSGAIDGYCASCYVQSFLSDQKNSDTSNFIACTVRSSFLGSIDILLIRIVRTSVE